MVSCHCSSVPYSTYYYHLISLQSLIALYDKKTGKKIPGKPRCDLVRQLFGLMHFGVCFIRVNCIKCTYFYYVVNAKGIVL